MESIEDLLTCMPKVELHAHLNGSISDRLLKHLKDFGERKTVVQSLTNCRYFSFQFLALYENLCVVPTCLQNTGDANTKAGDGFPLLDSEGILMEPLSKEAKSSISKESSQATSLKECWVAFAKIHDVIRTLRILYVATANVIAEFSQDNVIYLEIRTSPKKIHDIPSKLCYIEAVVNAIKDCQQRFPISVKLLTSIDRKNGEEESLETVQLATTIQTKYPDIMVGIDVSGDPRLGDASWIVRVMQDARNKGLKISCHLPEIVNPQEGLAFMRFGPERVGHGQYLHPLYGGTNELWELTKEKNIPIECCISSNLVSGVTTSVDTHVVKICHMESVPFIICTDDCGVFKTSLSTEFRKLLSVVPLSFQQLRALCLEAVRYAFTNDEEKDVLTKIIYDFWQKRI